MGKNTKTKKNRDDITGKRAFTDISQLALFILFITIWIIDSFFLKRIYFFSVYFPLYIRIPIAIIFLFLGLMLVIHGMRIVFGEIRQKPHVITKGVFSIIRHPIYLGAMFIYLTFFVLTFSILSSIIFVIIVIFYFGLALSEEKLLIKRFGIEYKQYMKSVPMLLPHKINRKKNN